MTEHRESYPALSDEAAFAEIGAMERSLDGQPPLGGPDGADP